MLQSILTLNLVLYNNTPSILRAEVRPIVYLRPEENEPFLNLYNEGWSTIGFTRHYDHCARGDYDDGEIGGMITGRGNRNTRRKPVPVPLCPPQNPHASLDAKPGRRGGKPATNRYGTAKISLRRKCIKDFARPEKFSLYVVIRISCLPS
jgi:hypothetical protein